MAKNASLRKADRVKDDEFFTQIVDIENELKHYKDHFKDKVVFCNCDDPEYSNFWRYFNLNFDHLGLKRLLATHYQDDKQSYMLEMWRDSNGTHSDIKTLKQNGDFRSPECIGLLEQADIVITNPPFSLFREYVNQLMEYEKHFLIIANQNAITYKEIFPLLKDNRMWLGYKSGDMAFTVPDNSEPRTTRFWIDDSGQKWRSFGNICWFTNLDIPKRHEELLLYRTYNETDYPRFDNYNAINVDKVVDIPCDYDGLMGVPITFLNSYNPEQFEIIDGIGRYSILDNARTKKEGKYLSMLNGKAKYFRIVIKRREQK